MIKADTEKMIAKIHCKALDIKQKDTDHNTELLILFSDYHEEIYPLLKHEKLLDYYCEKYEGFYYVMKMLENLASDIEAGRIKAPPTQ